MKYASSAEEGKENRQLMSKPRSRNRATYAFRIAVAEQKYEACLLGFQIYCLSNPISVFKVK